MGNDFINDYKREYGQNIPDIWERVRLGVAQSQNAETVKGMGGERVSSPDRLTITERYPQMVLMAASIIIMVFILPMSIFLLRHQYDNVFAAPYVAEIEGANATILAVSIVDGDLTDGFIDNAGNMVVTRGQLNSITQTVILTIIGGVGVSAVSFSLRKIQKRRKAQP